MPQPTQDSTASPAQRRVVGRGGYFALSFGTIIGSAWLAVLGHWLGAAGPGGALLGFLLGAAVVLLIACCYAELAARLPEAGGEFLYALKGLGERPAFLVGWFLTLDAIAVAAFEGVVLAMFLTRLLPALAGPELYRLLGHGLSAGGLAIGLGGALVLGLVNARGLRGSIAFQRVATYLLLAVVAALLAGGLAQGEARHLEPWFASATERPWWLGTVWIFATCALFLNGFQVALYTLEERKPGLGVRSAVLTMIWGLVAAVAFYCLIVLSTGALLPWRALVETELPAVAAYMQLGPPRLMEVLVLGVACVSLLKTWNALVIFGSQLLVAQARHGMLPAAMARLDPRTGTPVAAIACVTAGSMALVLFGRGVVLPIVNMVSICLSLTFVLSLAALLRLRRRDAARTAPVAFRVPGGDVVIRIAMLGAIAMAGVALVEPAIRARGVPVEWMLLAAWGVAGAVFRRRRRPG